MKTSSLILAEKREACFSRTPKKDGGNPGAPGGLMW